jgi:hypothetical protein
MGRSDRGEDVSSAFGLLIQSEKRPENAKENRFFIAIGRESRYNDGTEKCRGGLSPAF